ncbi:MAG: Oxidoreductase alpha (Molybdopterin) subunit, partial [Xanthomonadaceae bacterium]|nr:Oxidoreductase alpha (Molybdopterin) subunit [Xanthomonadaceae bacterium]
QCISTEDSSSTVRASRGIQTPISEQQRSEPAIVAQLAQAIGCAPTVPWNAFADDYAAIRDRIEQCQRGVTEGFEKYNDRLLADGRFALPNSATRREWHTANGKARFIAHPLRDDSPVQQARMRHGDAVLTLMTIRAHDQFNTTVYSSDDRYRGIAGDRHVVFLNADDLAARGITDGDRIDVETMVDDGHARRVSAWTARTWDIPRGCCAAYYPEASGLIAASVFSAGSRTPLYKEMPVCVSAHVALEA